MVIPFILSAGASNLRFLCCALIAFQNTSFLCGIDLAFISWNEVCIKSKHSGWLPALIIKSNLYLYAIKSNILALGLITSVNCLAGSPIERLIIWTSGATGNSPFSPSLILFTALCRTSTKRTFLGINSRNSSGAISFGFSIGLT